LSLSLNASFEENSLRGLVIVVIPPLSDFFCFAVILISPSATVPIAPLSLAIFSSSSLYFFDSSERVSGSFVYFLFL